MYYQKKNMEKAVKILKMKKTLIIFSFIWFDIRLLFICYVFIIYKSSTDLPIVMYNEP